MNHRIFIAINFPDYLKNRILECENKLKKFGWPVRWVGESNFELCLKFLGSVEDENLERLRKIVGEVVSKHQSFTIEFNDLIVFPNLNRPRIIAIRVLDNEQLLDLARELSSKIDQENIGQRDDKPFRGHITLGRLKNPAGHWQALSKIKFADSFTVKSVEIIESILKPEGPVYKVVESYKL
jgi:2'-5' RNA ligase